MSGGGGGGTNTVQKADPWSGTQPYLLDVYGQALNANRQTNTNPYEGNFVTQANGAQRAGVTETLNLANQFRGMGDSTIQLGQDTASGKYLNQNDYLMPAIQNTVRPMIEQARDITLPAIGSAAQEAGAYGGSRQALLESYAMRDTNKQVADTASQMMLQNYQNERQLMQNAPAMIQAGMTMNSAPMELLNAAGAQQYNLDNLSTQNALMQFQDQVNAPWRAVMPYTNVLSGVGMPGGTTTTTAPSGSATQGMLGGAMGGGMLGYMAGGGNPYWAMGGAALGGGMGAMR